MRRPTVERQYYSDEKRGTPAKVICTREEIRERYVTAIEVIQETGLSRSRVFALVAPCQRYEVTDAASGETRRMMRRVDVENAIYYKGYPGNPLWHSSSFQRRMIMRRWYKGSTKLMLSADSFEDYEDMIFGMDDGPVRVIGTVVWFQAADEME